MRIIHISGNRPGLKFKLLFALILFLVCAVGVLVALLTISMMLVGLPILVFGGLVYALLPKKRSPQPQRAREPDVLEGRYRVVQGEDRPRPDRDLTR